MIPNRAQQLARVTAVITKDIARINSVYRGGPSLHFYHRVRELRLKYARIRDFIGDYECVEILYATLLSWDMNSRGAKMKDHAEFWQNLRDSLPCLEAVEATVPTFTCRNRDCAIQALSSVYSMLDLMRTNGALVSNSKCLHFLFPSMCMPMDRTNTLAKLYGNTGESKNKFLEVLEFCHDVIAGIEHPDGYLDHGWNTCETKLVDNAIILL